MVIQKCSFRGSLLLRVSFFSWHCPPRFCGTYRHNITSWCVLKSELLFLAFAWFEHLLYVQCECCAWSSMTSFLTPTFLFTVFQQGPMCIASQAGHFRVMVGAIKFFCFFLVVFFFFFANAFHWADCSALQLDWPSDKCQRAGARLLKHLGLQMFTCALMIGWHCAFIRGCQCGKVGAQIEHCLLWCWRQSGHSEYKMLAQSCPWSFLWSL